MRSLAGSALCALSLACGGGPPGAPSNLRVVRASVDGIDLAWDLPDEDLESPVSVIERDLGGVSGFSAYLATATTTITDTGVQRGGNYQYRVRVVEGLGLSVVQRALSEGTALPKDKTSAPSNVELAGL